MTKPTRKRPHIDRQQIVSEALKLLNETSLSGLTMRELADRLGIRAASLYWHFPNKAALISEMSAHLFLEAIENAPAADTWQDWMRGVGFSVWDSLIDYPDSGLLVMMADLSEDQFNRNTAIIQRRLEKFDIDPDDAFRLHSGIQALVTGWITFAHSPYIRQLESVLDVKVAAMETLEAMIRGWQPKPMIEKS